MRRQLELPPLPQRQQLEQRRRTHRLPGRQRNPVGVLPPQQLPASPRRGCPSHQRQAPRLWLGWVPQQPLGWMHGEGSPALPTGASGPAQGQSLAGMRVIGQGRWESRRPRPVLQVPSSSQLQTLPTGASGPAQGQSLAGMRVIRRRGWESRCPRPVLQASAPEEQWSRCRDQVPGQGRAASHPRPGPNWRFPQCPRA